VIGELLFRLFEKKLTPSFPGVSSYINLVKCWGKPTLLNSAIKAVTFYLALSNKSFICPSSIAVQLRAFPPSSFLNISLNFLIKN
jgi:hypothetical protein